MKKRLLLMLVMMLCLLALGIGIAPAEEITVSAPAPEFETVEDGLSAKDAFEGYILQTFGQPPARRVLLKATRPLTGASGILYGRLAALVKDVAAGKQSSTTIKIPMGALGLTKYSYTAEDLGIDSIFGDGEKPTDEAVQKFYYAVYDDIGLDLATVGRKLRLDLPYDMYWASNSYMTFGGFYYSYDSSRTSISVSKDGSFEYSVEVSLAYRVSEDNPNEFNTSLASDVQQAAANAKAIVARYANASSDYGKLRGYKNAICDLVDYNHDAADDDSTPYGDPWQLVWVFDGNPSTKVVCEGYSKAFKYLCDMSSFAGDTSASSVTGWMSGGTGAGAHMWNIVTMNGVNYLVDVTNCDGEPNAGKVSVGYPDYLFMVGYSDTSDTADGTWYIYRAGQNSISYLYDADISNLYAAEDLAITTAGHAVDPYILASAETIELGESITLTVSVPGKDETHFEIPYEQNGITGEIEGPTPSYRQNEMILDFTPESAGEYVFYAGYTDETAGIHRTDASVRVTVTASEPDPLTVITEGVIGTDVTVQVVKQEGWDNLSLDIEYLPEGESAESISWTDYVPDSFTVIGTNFLKAGTYRVVLSRILKTPEGDLDFDNPEELASVEFQMADQGLAATQGVLSAEEITVGDELTFTCPGAEALACHLRMTDPVTGDDIWGTNPPIDDFVPGDTLSINYQNTAGILEGSIWAKEAGQWKLPQEIQVTVNTTLPADGVIPLTLNVPQWITADGSEVWLSFTPQETGVYVLCSASSDYDDPYTEIYDSEKNYLNYSDDYKYGPNYQLGYSMTAGQRYYYLLASYGSYIVHVVKSTGLEVSAVGGRYPNVEYGESVTLEVAAVSNEPEITFMWFKDGEEIEGAVSSKLEIPSFTDPETYYTCRVSDGVLSRSIEFYVTFNNHFFASADPDRKMWERSIDVVNGSPARMQVYASCAHGDLHYTWYNSDIGEVVPGSGDTNICETSDYEENSQTHYYCEVTDDYGNEDYIWFTVYSDNHLQANCVGGYYRKILPYGDVDLEVKASCISGNITYQWQAPNDEEQYEDIPGETNSVLQLKKVGRTRTYLCLVQDEFGHETSVEFNVTVDNEFSVKAVGGTVYNVIPGDDLTLEVNTHHLEGQLHFLWQTYDYEADEYVVLQEGGSSYTLRNLTDFTEINCSVQDDFGNSAGVKYEIRVNHMIQPASATRFNLDWGGTAQMSVKAAADSPYPASQLQFRWRSSYDGYRWNNIQTDSRAASYTTWALDRSMTFQCEAYYDDGEDIYESETVYFYVNVAPRHATPGDLIISPVSGKTDQNMYFGAEGADISSDIDAFTVDNLDEVKEHQSGKPQWTVETVKGTADANVTFDGKKASLKVKSFPDTAESAKYLVKCVWGKSTWEQEIIVHYLDLSGNPEPVIQPTWDGNFWIVPAGTPVNPKDFFTVSCGWTPSGGESMKYTAAPNPSVQSHLTAGPDSGTWTPQEPGGYDFNMKLSFANVSWSKSWIMYASRPDGTVPTGSYRSQGGNTLALPKGLTEIGDEAFIGSPAEIVVIPEGCVKIGSKAFSGMPNLKEITIPSSVSVIGTQIFDESGSFAVYANSEAAVEAALGYAGLLVLTK